MEELTYHAGKTIMKGPPAEVGLRQGYNRLTFLH